MKEKRNVFFEPDGQTFEAFEVIEERPTDEILDVLLQGRGKTVEQSLQNAPAKIAARNPNVSASKGEAE